MRSYNSIIVSLVCFANNVNVAITFSTPSLQRVEEVQRGSINTHKSTASFVSHSTKGSRLSPTSSASTSLSSSGKDDEEWHPRDPAKTTPQLLSSLWLQVAQGCKSLSKGVSRKIAYNLFEPWRLIDSSQFTTHEIISNPEPFFMSNVGIKYSTLSRNAIWIHTIIPWKTHGAFGCL